jgi:MYXO-CTERM domain-containing protein
MMMRRTLSRSTLLWLATAGAITIPGRAAALDPFEDATADLGNPDVHSGVALGIFDMNGDGLDDLVRLDETSDLEIEYQQDDGSWERATGPSIPGYSWSLSIADIDGNGYPDIFAGGAYDGKKILLADDDGGGFTLTTLPNNPSIFVQCSSFVDIDNDGDIDLFICHDDDLSVPYRGDGTGSLTYDPTLISAESPVAGNNAGNYGNTWTDYDLDGDLDLYLAKCRLGENDPMDGDRINLLFENDGSGNFTEVALAHGLRPYAQSWAADFGDLDNDNDFDAFIINHDMRSQLRQNDGEDNFTDVTDASGMNADLDDLGTGLQVHFEDFDNDTFLDILVTGNDGEHFLFINNGDMTFDAESSPFPTGGRGIHSAVVGDLNDDGFPDILAGFATGYNNPSNVADAIYLNPGNDNHWFNVRLTGVDSNPTATGAMVEVHGPWGIQRREVRTGESYGITNSATRHFGIGDADAIDQVVIRWPSGTVDTIDDPPIDVTVHVTEGCAVSFYADTDGDGYGDADDPISGCIPPEGYVEDDQDCDDGNEATYPGAEEICDGEDNNCDGDVDEGLVDCDTGDSSSSSGGDTTGDPPDTTVTASATGTPPTTTSPTTDTSGDETGDETGDEETAGANEDSGCGCNARRPTHGAWLLLFVIGAALRRRRNG